MNIYKNRLADHGIRSLEDIDKTSACRLRGLLVSTELSIQDMIDTAVRAGVAHDTVRAMARCFGDAGLAYADVSIRCGGR